MTRKSRSVPVNEIEIIRLWQKRPGDKKTEDDVFPFYLENKLTLDALISVKIGDPYQRLYSILSSYIVDKH
jgi:hypothetical protein